MEKLINGLPSLIGVILGIRLYANNSLKEWLWIVGIFGFVFVLMTIGKSIMVKRPRLAMLLIESWVLSSVCIVAISTSAIVWLSINSPALFDVPKDQIKVVTGVFIGAISAYFAAVWTSDISKGDGFFWPTTHLKNAFLKFGLSGDNKYVDAATAERVRDNGPKGWGILARWQRANILAAHVLETKNSV